MTKKLCSDCEFSNRVETALNTSTIVEWQCRFYPQIIVRVTRSVFDGHPDKPPLACSFFTSDEDREPV